MSINLLPEELRRPEPKPIAARPDIRYTNPARQAFGERRPEVVSPPPAAPRPWYRRLLGHGRAAPPAVKPAPPAAGGTPPTVGRSPVPVTAPLPTHVVPVGVATTKRHWWSGKPKQQSEPAAASRLYHHTGNHTGSGQKNDSPLHQPTAGATPAQNGSTLAVDLLADRSEFFTPKEFYRRLYRSGIAVVVVGIIISGGYLGLRWWQRTTSQDGLTVAEQITTLQQQLAAYQQTRAQVQELDERLSQIQQLLDAHPFWSKIFAALEQYTLPTVSYQSLTVDPKGGVRLSATAPDYLTVAQQVAVWQQQTDSVASVSFSTAALTKHTGPAGTQNEAIAFELLLSFTPEYFLSAPAAYDLAR